MVKFLLIRFVPTVFILTLICAVSTGLAQSIQGTVTSQGGEPIVYASIYVKELKMGTSANSNGSYFINLPAGKYTVVYRSLGFETVEKQVDVSNDNVTLNVILDIRPYQIAPVTIGSKAEDPAYAIIRKAIGYAPYYQNQVKEFDAEVYLKGTLKVKTEKLFSYGFLCIFIGIMLSVFQQAVGINAVLYYAPRIFQDMGMQSPMVQTVIMGIVNISFTLVAVFTVERIGRKPLLIIGSIGMAVGAFGVALTFGNAAVHTVTMLCIMLYSASFMMSWGPICWVLIAEIFPNTIRGKAVAIAVAFQWIFNWIVSSTFVPMFNMHLTQGDNFGHWFTYGLYGIICIIAAIFVWRLVPETKGKTLEDMTQLWRKKKTDESETVSE